uniref:Uncharacterized protein n=1 Tax=Rangifer tarandus platyrhynchus TaxID=3082113 RepID=A0ACB0DY31_RANTA|nr:unnamed protein product [Rangifer tarandus platyrhynchus]
MKLSVSSPLPEAQAPAKTNVQDTCLLPIEEVEELGFKPRLPYSWVVLLTPTPYILRGVPVRLRFGPCLLPLCPAPFPLRSVGYPVFTEGDLYIFQRNVTLDTQLLLLDCATYLKLVPPASGGHPHHRLRIFISLSPLALGTTCGLGSQEPSRASAPHSAVRGCGGLHQAGPESSEEQRSTHTRLIVTREATYAAVSAQLQRPRETSQPQERDAPPPGPTRPRTQPSGVTQRAGPDEQQKKRSNPPSRGCPQLPRRAAPPLPEAALGAAIAGPAEPGGGGCGSQAAPALGVAPPPPRLCACALRYFARPGSPRGLDPENSPARRSWHPDQWGSFFGRNQLPCVLPQPLSVQPRALVK